jgi:hypothetical protein
LVLGALSLSLAVDLRGKMSALSLRAAALSAVSSPLGSSHKHHARSAQSPLRIEFIRSRPRKQLWRRETPVIVVASAISNNDARRSTSTPSSSPKPPPPPPLPGSAPAGFSCPDASRFRLAVLGDLHYDPRDEKAFAKAQEQLSRVLREKAEGRKEGEGKEEEKGKTTTAARLVQLGDLGASSFAPGTLPCFEHARAFLGCAAAEGEEFGAPPALVAGNHG